MADAEVGPGQVHRRRWTGPGTVAAVKVLVVVLLETAICWGEEVLGLSAVVPPGEVW